MKPNICVQIETQLRELGLAELPEIADLVTAVERAEDCALRMVPVAKYCLQLLRPTAIVIGMTNSSGVMIEQASIIEDGAGGFRELKDLPAFSRILSLANNQSQPVWVRPGVRPGSLNSSIPDQHVTSESQKRGLPAKSALLAIPFILNQGRQSTLTFWYEDVSRLAEVVPSVDDSSGAHSSTELLQPTSVSANSTSNDASVDYSPNRALQVAQVLSDCLANLIRQYSELPKANLAGISSSQVKLESKIAGYKKSIFGAIQNHLYQFVGLQFESTTEGQQFAKQIHQLLDEHGLRVRCPECGTPAILRCMKSKSSPFGYFVFDHTVDGKRTFHGGPTTVPVLTITQKPKRKPPAASSKRDAS